MKFNSKICSLLAKIMVSFSKRSASILKTKSMETKLNISMSFKMTLCLSSNAIEPATRSFSILNTNN